MLSDQTNILEKEMTKPSYPTHTICLEKTNYEIYAIDRYHECTDDKIKNNGIVFNLKNLIKELENNNNGYHFRVSKTQSYILFGDCDGYGKQHTDFFELLINFLKDYYDIIITTDDILYTFNKSKTGSYHYSIPKYYASCSKLFEILTNFKKIYKLGKIIDTTIYSNHWFRLPNQHKEHILGHEHIIQTGKMIDFIVEYIPKDSICIDNKLFISRDKKTIKSIKMIQPIQIINLNNENNKIIKLDEFIDNKDEFIDNKDNFIKLFLDTKYELFYKFFDECYDKSRFDDYQIWISVGFAIKNKFSNEGFDLFNYFSSKGDKYEGVIKTKIKYDGFTINDIQNKATISSLYYYALQDNKSKYIELIKKYSLFKEFNMSSTALAKYIHHLKPNDFIWQNDILYCFNGKIWKTDNEAMKHYISNDLHDFLKNIIVECFWNDKEFNTMKSQLRRLEGQSLKKEIVETTKEYMKNDNIEFDNKWWLFGFNNVVYDLKEHKFRDYKYDDYIATTTGYDWIEPIDEEVNEMNEIINKILPNKEIRELYLTILSTSFEGRCLERLTICNGAGRNAKSFLGDMMLSVMGPYGLIGNNAVLFEIGKTGCNPEKANMHKKRFVLFREPPENRKIQNSVYKELTGGGSFASRGLYESESQKKLHCTIVLECNAKPLFAEEPTVADANRIIDILFGSFFTEEKEKIDEKNHIYPVNKYYKTEEFKDKYKRAFVRMLLDKYKNYADNEHNLMIPDCVKNRTTAYLELSCNIITWFKENYEYTKSRKDYVKMKDIYEIFKSSDYFFNLAKNEKRKYNYKYFNDYFMNHVFYSKCYTDNYKDLPNRLEYHKYINND